MDDANLMRAVGVLERHADVGLPMMVLHAAMHRTGAANLTLAALEQGLRERHDLFAVIDPPSLPWDVGLWPTDVLPPYRRVFSEIGFAADIFVVLRPDPVDTHGLVAFLRATVVALRDGGPGLPTEAARALVEANAVNATWRGVGPHRDETGPPTTPLPDRRSPARDQRRPRPPARRRLPSA